VRVLESGVAKTGFHQLAIDRGNNGGELRSGVYFLRLRIGSETRTRSVVIAE
jgi:hypothetical protein